MGSTSQAITITYGKVANGRVVRVKYKSSNKINNGIRLHHCPREKSASFDGPFVITINTLRSGLK